MNTFATMNRPDRILAATCSLGAAAAILAAAPVTAVAAPLAPAPRVSSPPAAGTCWKMTDAELNSVSYAGSKVARSTPHVVETTGAVAIPAAVARTGRGSIAMSAYARQACRSLNNAYTGFTSLAARPGHKFARVDKSSFAGFAQAQGAWFAPTSDEWAVRVLAGFRAELRPGAWWLTRPSASCRSVHPSRGAAHASLCASAPTGYGHRWPPRILPRQ